MTKRPAIQLELPTTIPHALVAEITALVEQRAHRLDAHFAVPDSWQVTLDAISDGVACTVVLEQPSRLIRMTARNADAKRAVRDAFDAVALRLARHAYARASALT